MSDTSSEIDARYRAMVLARPPGGERLKITSAMFEMTRQLLIAAIRAARPEITEVELRQELFLRYYGEEFTPDQRDRILAGIAAYWSREESSRLTRESGQEHPALHGARVNPAQAAHDQRRAPRLRPIRTSSSFLSYIGSCCRLGARPT